MVDADQRLPFAEKVGYAAGDAAASFVFMTMILFQTNFYTDVLGITASEAAAVMLVTRLWDAVADPVVGVLADRTRTRWGKFRPWILCTALPWCLAMIFAYTTPVGWSRGSLIAYAVATNMFLMSIYSMNNMPYAALGGVMTANVNERAKLNSVRFIAVNMAQFVVGGLTLPLVAKFSAVRGPQHGWQVTMSIWAVLCLVLFLITFASTRERVQPPPRQKADLRGDLAALARNHPWRVMFLMTLFHFCVLSFRGAALYNYYHHYANPAVMYDWAQALGLTTPAGAHGIWGSIRSTLGYVVQGDRSDLGHSNVADVFNSVVNLINTVVTIVVIWASSGLSARFGKKAVAVCGFGLAAVGTAGFYCLGPSDVGGMLAFTILIAACYAPTIPLIWAIYADVADYSEWKAERRCTGMAFATIGFALKCGLALGSSSFLWIMVIFFHYDARSPDTALAGEGFRACSGLAVAFLFLVCTLLLIAYKLDKHTTIRMEHELAARREPVIGEWTQTGGKTFAGQYRR
jgi:GPH family glycoside/pentoside/hexuronide:cation symporter